MVLDFFSTPLEAEAVFRLDCRLITAPPQRHIQGLPCKLFTLRQRRSAVSHANGKRDVHAVVDPNLPCLVQHVEPVVHDLVEMAGFHDRIEQVVFHLADHAVRPLHKALQHTLHLGGNLCLFALSGVLQQVVVAVDDQKHDAGTGIGVLVLQPENVCDLRELHCHHFPLILNAGGGVHPIAQPVVLHQQITAVIQCCQIQMDDILHILSQHIAAGGKAHAERLVIPENLAAVRSQKHRCCHMLQRRHSGCLDLPVKVLHVLPFRPPQKYPLEQNRQTQQHRHQKQQRHPPSGDAFQR